MMHDQKGPAGNKTTVGTILTRADHGNSEDGVLGMTLQPGFDLADPNKRNVFVYYSPRPGPNDNWPTWPRRPRRSSATTRSAASRCPPTASRSSTAPSA